MNSQFEQNESNEERIQNVFQKTYVHKKYGIPI